ncbi:MAG: hypothetical protein ABIR16_00025, partial [Dokdonella sp.]
MLGQNHIALLRIYPTPVETRSDVTGDLAVYGSHERITAAPDSATGGRGISADARTCLNNQFGTFV